MRVHDRTAGESSKKSVVNDRKVKVAFVKKRGRQFVLITWTTVVRVEANLVRCLDGLAILSFRFYTGPIQDVHRLLFHLTPTPFAQYHHVTGSHLYKLTRSSHEINSPPPTVFPSVYVLIKCLEAVSLL